MNLFMFPFAHGVYDDAELTHDEFEVKTNDVQVSLSIILQQRILNFFSSKKIVKMKGDLHCLATIHTVRNLHFLSKNSTVISREKLSNCFG